MECEKEGSSRNSGSLSGNQGFWAKGKALDVPYPNRKLCGLTEHNWWASRLLKYLWREKTSR